MKKVLIVLIVIVLAGCSMQKKLDRSITGLGREVLISELGEPMRIVDLDDGKQLFVYIKESYVRATEIGQGKPSLDPRISPGFVKEEIFKFVINKDGIVESSSYKKNHK